MSIKLIPIPMLREATLLTLQLNAELQISKGLTTFVDAIQYVDEFMEDFDTAIYQATKQAEDRGYRQGKAVADAAEDFTERTRTNMHPEDTTDQQFDEIPPTSDMIALIESMIHKCVSEDYARSSEAREIIDHSPSQGDLELFAKEFVDAVFERFEIDILKGILDDWKSPTDATYWKLEDRLADLESNWRDGND